MPRRREPSLFAVAIEVDLDTGLKRVLVASLDQLAVLSFGGSLREHGLDQIGGPRCALRVDALLELDTQRDETRDSILELRLDSFVLAHILDHDDGTDDLRTEAEQRRC